MWEQIRANKRNSILLLALMATVLALLGWFIGRAFSPDPAAGLFGIVIALFVWMILAMVSFAGGDAIFLAASKATPVTKDVHPQLFNVVEEMAIAAQLPMPKIYIINDPAPNAFATGRNPQKASVAITAGLLGRLNRDELQGVIAHEMSHILHRDILFVTVAGVMLGAIVLISEIFLRGMFFSSMSRRYSSRSRSSGGGQAQAIMLVVAIIAAILAPIMATLLYFALSRKREYLADAGAARLTRYPEGLASALEKLSQNTTPLSVANKVTAPMYIVNPLQKKGMKLSDLTSTHPPISERVRVLRGMAGASFADYSEAFRKTTKHSTPIPSSALKDEAVQIRSAGSQKSADSKKQIRDIGDIMQKTAGFHFVNCSCGLKMKVPPNYKAHQVKCPRCGKISAV
ncbi:MAG: peptidase M28 [Planctomycetes bacterium HGW-Planctomycetes-1]|nr:MAG: peptidase M28 [Planctomycetes bacterium HGW-Planctomycetes-1]